MTLDIISFNWDWWGKTFICISSKNILSHRFKESRVQTNLPHRWVFYFRRHSLRLDLLKNMAHTLTLCSKSTADYTPLFLFTDKPFSSHVLSMDWIPWRFPSVWFTPPWTMSCESWCVDPETSNPLHVHLCLCSQTALILCPSTKELSWDSL